MSVDRPLVCAWLHVHALIRNMLHTLRRSETYKRKRAVPEPVSLGLQGEAMYLLCVQSIMLQAISS